MRIVLGNLNAKETTVELGYNGLGCYVNLGLALFCHKPSQTDIFNITKFLVLTSLNIVLLCYSVKNFSDILL